MYGLEIHPLSPLGATEMAGQYVSRSDIGFIAQEVQPLHPHVSVAKDPLLSMVRGSKLCPEVVYQNASEHARRSNAFNLVIDFNIHEHLGQQELYLLNHYNLPPLIPLDLYLSWRSMGHRPPNTDDDFSQFFGFIVEELELFYEASGLDLHIPAFGQPTLHDAINLITQPIMEMATRLGGLADPQTQTVFESHPNARYMIDTCRQLGASGVGVSFEIQPPRDIDDPYHLATQQEAHAGTTGMAYMTPMMVRQAILDITDRANTAFAKLLGSIPVDVKEDPPQHGPGVAQFAAGLIDKYGLGSP